MASINIFLVLIIIYITLYNNYAQMEYIIKLNNLFDNYKNTLDYNNELYKNNINIIEEYNYNMTNIFNYEIEKIYNYKHEIEQLKTNINKLKNIIDKVKYVCLFDELILEI